MKQVRVPASSRARRAALWGSAAGVLWACSSAPNDVLLSHETPSTGADAGSPPGADDQPTPLGPDATVDAADAAPAFSAGAIKVCPSGCDHTLPSAAVAAAKDGAVIEILAGTYEDCFAIHANQVTVRGVGGFAHLHTKMCDGKGIVVNYGQGTHLERLELSGFANADYNGAAVRHDVVGKDLTLSGMFIHDGQLGVLASSTGDTVTVDSSLFRRVGVSRPDGEISVPLYVTGAQKLVVRRSRFLEGVAGASMIKSRALSTSIACSVIANLDGPDSYSIDLQLGNEFSLVNSVVEQSAATQNKIVIAYGSTSFTAATAGSFSIRGNTFINDASGGTIINLFNGAPGTFDISGNTFIGSGTPLNGGGQLGVNVVLATRPASLGAYPALPEPGACP